MVLDDPFLFSVSIRDNIAYGRPDAPFEEVEAAAVAAGADGFIRELPEGYDTVVGERGFTLSGGQRQRISIARTLLVNPPILILDDATSAIDVQVEQQIHAALEPADDRPDHADHRPPALDDQPRRPRRRGRGRPRHRRWAPTPSCWRPSLATSRSWRRSKPRKRTTLAAGRGRGRRRRATAARARDRRRRRRDPAPRRRGRHRELTQHRRRNRLMAWGGGGGMFGGGGRGSAAARPGNPGNGLPFAGIPSELQAGVEKLLDTEPDWPTPDEKFSHRVEGAGRHAAPHARRHRAAHAVVRARGGRGRRSPGRPVPQPDRHRQRHHAAATGPCSISVRRRRRSSCVVITAVASGWRVAVTGRLSSRVMFELRVRVFAHLQRLSLDYYTDEKAGVIMTRMTSDIEALQQLLQEGLVQFAVQGLTMVVVTVILFFYSVTLALITLLLIVPDAHGPVALVPQRVRPRLQPGPRRHRRSAERPVGEPVGRARRRRVQPRPPQRAAPPQRRRRVPRRQRLHRRASPRSTAPGAS